MTLEFIAIRVSKDNLMYLFFDATMAFSVDSTAPNTLIHALSCQFTKQYYTEAEVRSLPQTVKRRRLAYAFTTHWHSDHAGGNQMLASISPETILYNTLETVHLPSFQVKPVPTPCHTLDSVSFVVESTQTGGRYVLSGDFLFKLGCGRFFEGSAEIFQASLKRLLENVDDKTLLLSGHDYYEANKRFAEQFYPVVGCESFFSSIGEEREYNPFLNPGKTVGGECDITKRISELRRLKDEFS